MTSTPARVCVVGAGAVGGMIGARLAAQDVPVAALARGATAVALERDGWRLQEGDRLVGGPCRVARDAAELGEQDLVVVAVKAQSLAALAPSLQPLIGPGTVVVPAMNGVPWWFTEGLPGPAAGARLRSVDPDGAIARALPPASVVGCVVHLSAATSAPGLSVHAAGNRLVVGDPGRDDDSRLEPVARLLETGGFDVVRSPDVHREVWFKLWGNLTMNPLSVLTGATTDVILDDDLLRDFVVAVMTEAAAVGRRIGCPIRQSPAERIEVTRELGRMRTSMLQDAEAGRTLELDALVGAVVELGDLVDVAMPQTSTLLGLARVAGRARGLYPA